MKGRAEEPKGGDSDCSQRAERRKRHYAHLHSRSSTYSSLHSVICTRGPQPSEGLESIVIIKET